jgi:hypothetical protein
MGTSARRIQAFLSVAVLSVSVSACVTVEGDPGAPEARATGRLCTAQLTLAGMFQPGAPDPDTGNKAGCWPVGNWTFTAAMGDSSCTMPPTLESQYAFTDTRDADNVDTITYLNSPGDDHVHIKVNAGDGGVCVGIMEVIAPDNRGVVTLRPALQMDNSLVGTGEYDLYDSDQFAQ